MPQRINEMASSSKTRAERMVAASTEIDEIRALWAQSRGPSKAKMASLLHSLIRSA